MNQSNITNQQLDELTRIIASKCEEWHLQPVEILDGLARVALSAAEALGIDDFEITTAAESHLEGKVTIQIKTKEDAGVITI